VAFCDQDDVWLPGKIRMAAEAIHRDSSLTLILQNAFICDDQLQHDGRVFPNAIPAGTYGARSRYGFWVWLGCLQTFRAELFTVSSATSLPPNYYEGHTSLSHDKWTCLVANALGGICVLGEPVALYRRHQVALTGFYGKQSGAERLSISFKVGSGEYLRQSRVADETASYLRVLALASSPKTAKAFVASANDFSTMSSILRLRSFLYSDTAIPRRIIPFLRILAKGGYIGPGIIALGWKSGAKDLAHALGLFGLLRKLIR
jgi:hypothetical protein